ncbi:MAG: 1-acyl-sn-glycerol-3-phosphate acyltransferase [Acetobacteraceae bacterium]|nr:1-acyl-sn-glycerol-3-phosphate acyltransferase [Acetobacteraceae bacterium]
MILVRSILFNLFFFGSSVLLTIPAFAVSLIAPRQIKTWARFWARLQIAAVRVICGIRLEVSGWENLPPGPALIASRHESAFDILAWLALVPASCFVVKRELSLIPLFGRLIRVCGMISIDREAGGSAIRVLLRGGDRARAEGRYIVIFPEGTRVDPDEHPPLQPGVAALASRTGVPVVPVMTDSGLCWGRRAFHKTPGTIHIVIQKPLTGPHAREAVMAALQTAYGGT